MSFPGFSILKSYGVLANVGITATGTTTIANGFYGSYPTTTYTGPIIGTANDADAEEAQNELSILIEKIHYLTSLLNSVTLGTVSDNITLYPNINYNSSSDIFFDGINITLDCNGLVNPSFFIKTTTKLRFVDVQSISVINDYKLESLSIYWLGGTDIVFKGTLPPSIMGRFIAVGDITFENSANIYGSLRSQTGTITFTGPTTVNYLDFDPNSIVCYSKGSLILTKNGFVPIENIKNGDKIITSGKIHKNKYLSYHDKLKVEPVIWVSKFKVFDLNSHSRPICIKKDALGKNQPFRDLYVSPGHNLLLEGKMVTAKKLVNGETIYQDNECDKVEYYHLECENHSGIFANGILSESYLDVNNRDVFENSVRTSRKFSLKKLHTSR